ncbi:MAG: bifunctional 5,10-methylene-tetrahydrofolate dehydrogenase/5,10-methylene-tetrahydrofolate cyclohydrolase [Actinobacteria bacterium]|nr:bifunctional 5,10-methylene-tetrahydrofolate dehydrogenase/5,10-methylene-tetrahydrofolate cyclohydrolase [Actinomycetota bacterium]
MRSEIIDGKAIAEQVCGEIVAEVAKLAVHGVRPTVATVLVGEDGGAEFYRRRIQENTSAVGFGHVSHVLPATASEAEVLDLIADLNGDAGVHGVLVLMPMPAHISQARVFDAIDPIKDLDCVNPANIGHVLLGDHLFAPATPSACLEILDRIGVRLQGKDVTIVNRSNIVGKPLALLCLHRSASVQVVHSFTRDVAAACRRADVLISAAPVMNFIKPNMVKAGAVVLDVTTIRHEGRQVGSLDFAGVCRVASRVTPVPGGVGPVTNVMLLKNALTACVAQTKPTGVPR